MGECSRVCTVGVLGSSSVGVSDSIGVAGVEKPSSAVANDVYELARDCARGIGVVGERNAEGGGPVDGVGPSCGGAAGGSVRDATSSSAGGSTSTCSRVSAGGSASGDDRGEGSSALGDSTSGCDSDGPATSAKSGGGKSTLEADAAYAMASGPYGTPKRAKDSRDEMSRSCSGVGPDFGYVNSVRTSVCVSGDEMEFSEITEGEFRFAPRLFVERVRDTVRNADDEKLNTDPDPEWDGRCALPRPSFNVLTDAIDGPESSLACRLRSRDGRVGAEDVVGRTVRGLKMFWNIDRRRLGSGNSSGVDISGFDVDGVVNGFCVA